jgi:hypothetical protein
MSEPLAAVCVVFILPAQAVLPVAVIRPATHGMSPRDPHPSKHAVPLQTSARPATTNLQTYLQSRPRFLFMTSKDLDCLPASVSACPPFVVPPLPRCACPCMPCITPWYCPLSDLEYDY